MRAEMSGLCFRICAALLLSSTLLAMNSCDTKNVGGPGLPFAAKISSFIVIPATGTGLHGGEEATFVVEFTRSTGFLDGYQVAIDFGGAASPNVDYTESTSPFSRTVTLIDVSAPTSFTATARVRSLEGVTAQAATLPFTVQPSIGESLTSIDAITVSGNTAKVTVSNANGEDVTVTLDGTTGGLVGAPASQTVIGGNGTTGDFVFSASDFFAGASGTATFTATTDAGGTDTDTSGTITVGAPTPFVDALAAIPLASSASVNDTVKVVVVTGVLANPFEYMTGASLVFPPGCEYVPDSFDYGAPAAGDTALNPSAVKDQETVDGIWTVVNPSAGFLQVGDSLLPIDTDLPAPFTGRSAIDFNITPLNGTEAPAGTGGIMFNFNVRFTQPGSYMLDFLLFDDIKRTYYEDAVGTDYDWTDITNTNSYTTINVTP